MDIGLNGETATAGGGGLAVTMLAWWCKIITSSYANFKRKSWERMDKIENEARERATAIEQEIEEHALYDAQTYVPRSEMQSLRDFFDEKFDRQTKMIVDVIRDGSGRNHAPD